EANRDYTMVEGAFPNLGSMLVEKKVDLISLVLPFSEVAEKSGDVRPLFNVARASFLAKNRAALADFFEDYVRAQRWFLDPANRTQAVQIVADFNKRPVSVFAPYLFTPEDFHRDPNARPNLSALQRNMEQLKELGFLKTDIDVKRHADLSFVDGAVKRLDAAKK